MHQFSIEMEVGQASVIGTREEQQDAVLMDISKNCVLAAICDGMGGLADGAQASLTAIDGLRKLFQSRSPKECFADFFLRAADILDESVCRRKKKGNLVPSGTTIVAIAIERNQLYWLSIGDSRLYLIRGKEIVCVTTDHNYRLILNQVYRSGEMTKSTYEAEKSKGDALISYLGVGGIEFMDRNEKPFLLQPEDCILLMSDGLYRCVSKDEMWEISQSSTSAQNTADRLVERASQNAKENQDNTSTVVVKVNGV